MKKYTINSLPITKELILLNKIHRRKKFPFLGRFYFNKLKRILYKNGSNFNFSIDFFCKYGNIIGKNFDLNDTFCLDYDTIKIGEGTAFSYQNMILTSTHDTKNFNIVITKPVTIGKNCWITSRVIILPGVNIGDNVIVSAGSVVTKDVPSNVIVSGNPAVIVKKLNEINE